MIKNFENKKAIVDIVHKTQFQLDGALDKHYAEDENLLFQTRENGNVGNEVPGQKDLNTAYSLKSTLEKLDFIDEVKVEEVDEWILIHVSLKEVENVVS